MSRKKKSQRGKSGKSKRDGQGGRKPRTPSNWPKIEDELYKMGLRVKYMPADGNCFFRALGDQLFVMTFMELHRPLFELFVEPCLEENEDFDSYIKDMRCEGQWAGDFEVHAASLCFAVDICIYQIDGGKLQCLCNKNPESQRRIHISYHGGEHYNSVRKCGDYNEAPPEPFQINISNGTSPPPQNPGWSWKDEKRVMDETGCLSDGLIHTYLTECQGNVNEAIDRVIEWMRENGCMTDKALLRESGETNPLDVQCSDDGTSDTSSHKGDEYRSGNKVLREDEVVEQRRKPANNKPCPCGSRRKYKQCCKIVESKRQREAQRREEICDASVNEAPNQLSLLYI